MNTSITLPTLLVYQLLSIGISCHAQTVITPSGNTYHQTWAGFRVDGTPSQDLAGISFYSPLTTEGQTVTVGASFYANPSSGFEIAPNWQGEFSITGTKTSATTADPSSRYHYGKTGALTDTAGGTYPTNPAFTAAVGDFISSGGINFNLGFTTHTLDFTGLTNGYLPAGTLFYIYDMDAWAAPTHEGPMSITSNVTGSQFLDFNWQGQILPDVYDSYLVLPTVTWDAANGYVIDPTQLVDEGNSWDGTAFVTTQNLTSLTIASGVSVSAAHVFKMVAPTVPVPEPSGALLLTLSAAIPVLRRRRIPASLS